MTPEKSTQDVHRLNYSSEFQSASLGSKVLIKTPLNFFSCCLIHTLLNVTGMEYIARCS